MPRTCTRPPSAWWTPTTSAPPGPWGNQARQAGFLLGSNKLVDDAGKVLRGQKAVTDGPYSETKEVLGGYYLIEAASYEEAVRRSKDHPHLEHGGTIEVRQVEPLPDRRGKG
jgi:hypothetical protein